MADIVLSINRLINYALQRELIEEDDRVYSVNRLLALLGFEDFEWRSVTERLPYPAPILEEICDYVQESKAKKSFSQTERDVFDSEIMACLTPRPSEIVRRFYGLYERDKKSATDYYYALSRATNYIRVDRIEKDRMWTAATEYGDMVITINLSKPEKDPKTIAAARNTVQSGYPKCALCRENEGFMGNLNKAPRGNHRLIPVELCGESWFLQYSPYVYYNEHCIVISSEHRPMKVDRAAFEHLLGFIELFPHYFVGSNADLPIVGGSILSHDHFQGGNFEFPMAKAGLREEIKFAGFPQVKADIVNWPMSVIRLRCPDKEQVAALAEKILSKWREYSDESAEIIAYSDGAPHNTITPIARRRGADFEMDLVLRNNRTTDENPLGIFHPHAEYHHIKRENIGLIEVMGLAILPARLLDETEKLKEALLHPSRAEIILSAEDMSKHIEWYRSLKTCCAGLDSIAVQGVIEKDIGRIFKEILKNAGVYKDTPEGAEAMRRFCRSV